jgi:hypothetical protein
LTENLTRKLRFESVKASSRTTRTAAAPGLPTGFRDKAPDHEIRSMRDSTVDASDPLVFCLRTPVVGQANDWGSGDWGSGIGDRGLGIGFLIL